MRVSLNPVRKPILENASESGPALLDRDGAAVVLGRAPAADGLVHPVSPSASTLFGPRGAALTSPNGPLFVCDTGHHRLLIWNAVPSSDGKKADLLIGQKDFGSEGRNAKGLVGAATLNVPTGVSADGGVLAVADAWNHRVLIWHSYPKRSNQPADVVLGQADFTGGLANRGSDTAAADTLNWCYGVTISDGALYVADTGNRRVLIWNRIPVASGTPADLVLGQADFRTRDENAGHAPGPVGMRWPHGICVTHDHMFVADAGNNRIMVWDELPSRHGEPCSFVLGQDSMLGCDHNQVAYYPTAAALNMPYGVTRLGNQLVAVDTANCRVIGYDLTSLSMNAPATSLAGQRTFLEKGENRWGAAMRDSLCWPYGVSGCGSSIVIADSGNNRVLVWEAAR